MYHIPMYRHTHLRSIVYLVLVYNLPKYHKEYSQNIQHQLTTIDNSIFKPSNQMIYSSSADTHCRYHQQNTAISKYISELTGHLFDTGIRYDTDSTACLRLFRSIDESEHQRLATRHEVVLSSVKLFRMFFARRATRNISELQEW